MEQNCANQPFSGVKAQIGATTCGELLARRFTELPEDLSKHSQPCLRVLGGQTQAPNGPANLLFRSRRVWIEVAAAPKRLEQHPGEAFDIARRRRSRADLSRN